MSFIDCKLFVVCSAMVKQTSLTSAKSVVGTCPDMCPEKERYRREDTRRLSWFEVDHSTYVPGVSKNFNFIIQLQLLSNTSFPLQNAKVDHSKAIKEYSGSAADKVGDLEKFNIMIN